MLKGKDIFSVSLSMYSMAACLISAGFKGIRVPAYYMLWFTTTSVKEWLSLLLNVSSPVSSFHTPVFSIYFGMLSKAEDVTVNFKSKILFYGMKK